MHVYFKLWWYKASDVSSSAAAEELSEFVCNCTLLLQDICGDVSVWDTFCVCSVHIFKKLSYHLALHQCLRSCTVMHAAL